MSIKLGIDSDNCFPEKIQLSGNYLLLCHFATCHLSIDRLLIEGVKSTLFCYPTAVIEDKGKILAIDLGEKRIGLAVSDETRTIATGFGVLTRKSRREDFERYAEIIEAQGITLIVMGLPM